VHIHVPTLREHKEDIPLLVRYFIKSFGTDFSTIKDISRDAVSLLENYNWPGNVRELANAIRRAIALGTGERIIPGDLPSHLCPAHDATRMYTPPPDGTLESYEKAAIINALELSNGNRKKASEILKIGEATLYRKIAKYQIECVMPGAQVPKIP